MAKNTSTNISDETKRKIEFKSVGVGESERLQIYRLLSPIGGHHIVAASKGKILEDMRNSQDGCVRRSGAVAGITV